MSDNVIKFGKAAKAVKRSKKEKLAAENRARFGQKKDQKNTQGETDGKAPDETGCA